MGRQRVTKPKPKLEPLEPEGDPELFAEGEIPADTPAGETPEGRVCAVADCGNLLPEGSRRNRKWCDYHQPRDRRRPPSGKPMGRPRKEVRPPTLGAAPKRDSRADSLATVERNAKFIAEAAAGVMAMVAASRENRLLYEDAGDIQQGSGAWAKSVRDLAEHEDWLRRLLSGGKGSDRALAWTMFAIATGTMVLPILVRHKILPADVAGLVQAVPGAGPQG
jgi:hypothetical protein